MTANHLPATEGRITDAALIVLFGIGQACAIAIGAFATRDAFASLHGDTQLQTMTIAALILSGCLGASCFFLARRKAERLGQNHAINLRRTLYTHIATLPKSRHEQRRLGGLSLRFVGDMSAARMWYGRGLPDILTAAVVLPCAVAILTILDVELALSGSIPLVLSLIMMLSIAWHLERRHRHLRHIRANLAIDMIERIAIAPELDLLGRTSKELKVLDRKGGELRDRAVDRRSKTAALHAVLQMGVVCSGVAMLWHAADSGLAPAIVAASLSILALVARPLQDLSLAWDYYCAWRVARSKIQRLLSEPCVMRQLSDETQAVSIELVGEIQGDRQNLHIKAGEILELDGKHARHIARVIAGLEPVNPGLKRNFGSDNLPKIAYIADEHISLRGTLRRSAVMMCSKRPSDRQISNMFRFFQIGHLLDEPKGLNQRIGENGKGLNSSDTLRIDFVRAILGGAKIIVVDSIRWTAEHNKDHLLFLLRQHTDATLILTNDGRALGD